MTSSLKNMALVLTGIAFVASSAVGLVYRATEEPIEQAKQANIRSALGEVLPPFDESVSRQIEIDELPLNIYTASKEGNTVGYAVETVTKQGFSGMVRLMVGFDADGTVLHIKVLEHNETPGLGSKMTDEENPLLLSFRGKVPAHMKLKVRKDGGDVDALTAATISSRAYVDAIARAYNAYLRAADKGGSATRSDKQEEESHE